MLAKLLWYALSKAQIVAFLGLPANTKEQKELLDGKVHLVEIDLLRGGVHSTAVPRQRAIEESGIFDYHVCIHFFDHFEDFVRCQSPVYCLRSALRDIVDLSDINPGCVNSYVLLFAFFQEGLHDVCPRFVTKPGQEGEAVQHVGGWL